jgi:hypothetical protein
MQRNESYGQHVITVQKSVRYKKGNATLSFYSSLVRRSQIIAVKPVIFFVVYLEWPSTLIL